MAGSRPRSTKSDDEYRRRLEDDLNWRIFSNISLGAASALWRVIELGRQISREEVPRILDGTFPRNETPIGGSLIRFSIPFMFLAGLGVECLLKAIRILQFQAAGTPVAALNKRGRLALAAALKTHDLVGLAHAAGVSLSADELRLLERLTDFVEWAGRYPVGVAADQTTQDAGAYFPTDREAVFKLVERLRDECDRIDPRQELYERMEREIWGDDPPRDSRFAKRARRDPEQKERDPGQGGSSGPVKP